MKRAILFAILILATSAQADLRERIADRRYGITNGGYLSQLREIDRGTPRKKRTNVYHAAKREALAALKDGRTSDLHNAVWTMHEESWKAR